MFNAVLEKASGIYKFCHLSYSKPSVLVYNGHTIHSRELREGSQQGDPLCALLFCCTIQQLLLSLVSELPLGYVDDVTAGGPVSQVAQDVETIRRKGKEIGLRLNDKKCKLISKADIPINSTFENLILLSTHEAELLGAPLTVGYGHGYGTITSLRRSVSGHHEARLHSCT
jgi:hypothetical protein